MKVKDITQYLEQIAPLSLQESYDNSGLLVGSPEQEIKAILISLDCTEEIVEEAISKGCNLIVAHHPIIFGGLKKLNGSNYVERTVIKAIQNNVAIYAIHTNLDNWYKGVNEKIARQVGIQNCSVLAPLHNQLLKLITYVPLAHRESLSNALFNAGAGHIGNYSECSFWSEGTGTFKAGNGSNPFVGNQNEQHSEKEARLELIFPQWKQAAVIAALKASHPYEEVAYECISIQNNQGLAGSGLVGELPQALHPQDFLSHLKAKMELDVIRFTTFDKPIKRVAICGGAGSFLIKRAKAVAADAFITADVKYHEFFDAEQSLMIADIGHYESEKFTKSLIKELIVEKFPTFAILLSGINTNPIKYFS